MTGLLDYKTERTKEYNVPLSQWLKNLATRAKIYWAILETFYSGRKNNFNFAT